MYTPKYLKWDKSMSTGDNDLDAQHKYLLNTFNKLGDAILTGNADNSIEVVLNRLKFYVEWHFGKEEACMAVHNCPIAEKNKAAHTAYLRTFENFLKEYKDHKKTPDLAERIHESLSDWFMNHIIKVDTQLAPCIHQKH